jgi:hypothetical protein
MTPLVPLVLLFRGPLAPPGGRMPTQAQVGGDLGRGDPGGDLHDPTAATTNPEPDTAVTTDSVNSPKGTAMNLPIHNPAGSDTTYTAEVIDQALARNGNGDLQLVLTVKLLNRLTNSRSLADGTEPCPSAQHDVLVNFPSDHPERLGWAVRDLERLGFHDDDLQLLHPEHPEFHSLVGQQVHVRCRPSPDGDYWNLTWPRKPLGVAELAGTAGPLRSQIAEARKKVKGQPRVTPTAPTTEGPSRRSS